MRPIGGPHLNQPRSALAHDVGNTKATADFHQLAARDHRVASVTYGVEGEYECGGAVVHHHRVVGAGQLTEKIGAVPMPGAALAGVDVVLEIREAARDVAHGVECRAREGSAPEIRVEHHARRIDHGAQR